MARALLVKLQPNQDVTLALEEAVGSAGMGRVRIASGVGSLVEGIVETNDGIKTVQGPGIEVGALSGEVDPRGGSSLHAHLCCTDTHVVAGRLVRGRNAICVTFEVLLTECDPA